MAGGMHDAWALVGTKLSFWTTVNEYQLKNKLPIYFPDAHLRPLSDLVLQVSDPAFEVSGDTATLEAFVYEPRLF